MNQHISQEAFYSSNNTGLVNCLPLSLALLLSPVHCQITSVKSSLGVLNTQVADANGEQAHYSFQKAREKNETQSNGKMESETWGFRHCLHHLLTSACDPLSLKLLMRKMRIIIPPPSMAHFEIKCLAKSEPLVIFLK